MRRARPQTELLTEARLRRLAGRIHVLGPRLLYELFRELDHGTDLAETLERYARLPADFIRQHGGAELPETRLCASSETLMSVPAKPDR